MKFLIIICSYAFPILLFTQPSLAQFSKLTVAKQKVVFRTVSSDDGKSSEFYLTFSVASNGTISGKGKRFDYVGNGPSPSRTAGRGVTIVRNKSKLGRPINNRVQRGPESSGEWTVDCPFIIRLSDGAIIRGRVGRDFGSRWLSMDAAIVYKGTTGSKYITQGLGGVLF
jgi:hypothetical protein